MSKINYREGGGDDFNRPLPGLTRNQRLLLGGLFLLSLILSIGADYWSGDKETGKDE